VIPPLEKGPYSYTVELAKFQNGQQLLLGNQYAGSEPYHHAINAEIQVPTPAGTPRWLHLVCGGAELHFACGPVQATG